MRRIKFDRSKSLNIKKKLNLTLVEERKTHTARVYGIESLPDGKFVEVELGTNKVLIGGLSDLSKLIYNIRPDFTKPSFEEELYKGGVSPQLSDVTEDDTLRNMPWVQGFNVAYDGSQGDGVVETPRHSDGWDFEYLIPFRVIPVEMNDFARYKQLYLHHREVTIKGRNYIEYYTKKATITATAKFKDGTKVPDNPGINTTTDLDCRLIAEFPVAINEEELVEHWRLRKEEGAEGAHFNSTMLMMGNAAKINLGGVDYPTMINTNVYSKSNHVSVAHGIDAFISVKYQLLHI